MPVVKILDVVATQREVEVPPECPECGIALTNGSPLYERQLTDVRRPARLAKRSDPEDLDGNEGNGTVQDYRFCWELGNDDNFYWGPTSLKCECGFDLISGKLQLNTLASTSTEAARDLPDQSSLELNEVVASAVANDRVHWCRARLLHALAGAGKQGVLEEVVQELLPDDGETVAERIIDSLRASGWMRRSA